MTLNARPPASPRWRHWPWGLWALLLSLLAWGALLAAVGFFAASMGAPGDGSHAMQAMQGWILAAMVVLVASSLGSGVAAVMGWRLQRGRVCAVLSAVVLGVLAMLVLVVLASTQGPAIAAGDAAIWQVAGSRG